MHENWFVNNPLLVTLASALLHSNGFYNPALPYGRRWHKLAPTQPNTGLGAAGNAICVSFFGDDKKVWNQSDPGGMFHFDGSHAFGNPNNYSTTFFCLTYRKTGSFTTRKVIASTY